MPESNYEQLYKNLLVENTQLKAMLEQMQKNMQAALEGNNELRQQLKEVQEKLDALLARKKNRDRKDFDRKNEGRNPRPAPTSDRRQRNDCAEPSESEEAKPPIPDLPTEIIEHRVPPEQRVCPDCKIETTLVGTSVVSQLESVLQTLRWVQHHRETRSCQKMQNIHHQGSQAHSSNSWKLRWTRAAGQNNCRQSR